MRCAGNPGCASKLLQAKLIIYLSLNENTSIYISTAFDFITKNKSDDIHSIIVHFGEEYKKNVVSNIENTQNQRINLQFTQMYDKLKEVDKFIL